VSAVSSCHPLASRLPEAEAAHMACAPGGKAWTKNGRAPSRATELVYDPYAGPDKPPYWC
jgi:hypothetical protein